MSNIGEKCGRSRRFSSRSVRAGAGSGRPRPARRSESPCWSVRHALLIFPIAFALRPRPADAPLVSPSGARPAPPPFWSANSWRSAIRFQSGTRTWVESFPCRISPCASGTIRRLAREADEPSCSWPAGFSRPGIAARPRGTAFFWSPGLRASSSSASGKRTTLVVHEVPPACPPGADPREPARRPRRSFPAARRARRAHAAAAGGASAGGRSPRRAFRIQRFNVLKFGEGERLCRRRRCWAESQVPPRSLVISMQMSGALKFYTNLTPVDENQLTPARSRCCKNAPRAEGYQWFALLAPFENEELLAKTPRGGGRSSGHGETSRCGGSTRTASRARRPHPFFHGLLNGPAGLPGGMRGGLERSGAGRTLPRSL